MSIYQLKLTTNLRMRNNTRSIATLAIFCSNFVNLSREELDFHIDEDKYMLALNVHKFLNKVLHKSGKVVWSRR